MKNSLFTNERENKIPIPWQEKKKKSKLNDVKDMYSTKTY